MYKRALFNDQGLTREENIAESGQESFSYLLIIRGIYLGTFQNLSTIKTILVNSSCKNPLREAATVSIQS